MQDSINKKFNLEERTARLGEKVILFCNTIKSNFTNEVLLKQIIRSATSIGANYMEANGGNSKRDFRNKINICKKEAKETEHWLRMLSTNNPDKKVALRLLWQETHQLVLIFSKIVSSLNR